MVSYKALKTSFESSLSNTCHRIRNRDGGEAAAFIESRRPYARHTIADSNRGQTRAFTVRGTH